MKIPRIIARALSAIIVGFALVMFIGESMQSAKRASSAPMTLDTILQLTLFGIGLLGLVLAWKWELVGGILSLLAFIALFIVNPSALMIFIFPANAILFIFVAYRSKALNQKT
jgi:hypothetical protein